MKNVAVLVSGGGTNLQALIDAQNNGIVKSGKITLVISNKEDAYALVRAKNAGINTKIITKDSFKNKNDFEEEIISVLKENNIDYIVLAGFMLILSENFIKHFENRIINVHPSLIPSFCGEGFYGLKVHQAALEYGVYDAVPETEDKDTPKTLQRRVMQEAEWIILPLSLEKICSEKF